MELHVRCHSYRQCAQLFLFEQWIFGKASLQKLDDGCTLVFKLEHGQVLPPQYRYPDGAQLWQLLKCIRNFVT